MGKKSDALKEHAIRTAPRVATRFTGMTGRRRASIDYLAYTIISAVTSRVLAFRCRLLHHRPLKPGITSRLRDIPVLQTPFTLRRLSRLQHALRRAYLTPFSGYVVTAYSAGRKTALRCAGMGCAVTPASWLPHLPHTSLVRLFIKPAEGYLYLTSPNPSRPLYAAIYHLPHPLTF